MLLGDGPAVHLDEAAPGPGGLDQRVYLRARPQPAVPMMLEHL